MIFQVANVEDGRIVRVLNAPSIRLARYQVQAGEQLFMGGPPTAAHGLRIVDGVIARAEGVPPDQELPGLGMTVSALPG